MTAWNVIPDLHADPARLRATLAALGSEGRPAWLGDFIDGHGAEPDDAAVLEAVRRHVEAGAPAVMGNHELNAILFHSEDEAGPLRPRNPKNLRQHASFIRRFGIATPAALDWVGWFLTLPLWHEAEGGLRLVHACWNQRAIDLIAARRPDARLRPEDLPEVAAESTGFGRAVKLLLTGPEAALPAGAAFRDGYGTRRTQLRIAWWRPGARSWREAALSAGDPAALPEGMVGAKAGIDFYPEDAPPVLVGHYKMAGAPRIESPNAACLDYPRTPCAYRWRGEAALDPRHLVSALRTA